MPCQSYGPTDKEIETSRVLCLLGELKGNPIKTSDWEGNHPDSCKDKNRNLDKLTAELCSKLQGLDVTKQSLEMQIWWRDHKDADKKRLEEDLKLQSDRKKAIAKLSEYEKSILGLS